MLKVALLFSALLVGCNPCSQWPFCLSPCPPGTTVETPCPKQTLGAITKLCSGIVSECAATDQQSVEVVCTPECV